MAVREYWLQVAGAPDRQWNTLPSGIDRMGYKPANAITQLSNVLVIRRYTAGWQQPDDRKINPWD